jgi:hypothetical protein
VGGSRNAPLALEPRLKEVKPVCKPGSVQGRTPAAVIPLGRRLPAGSSNLPGSSASSAIAPLFGLAPDGVCQPLVLPQARCALTAPFHPYLCLAAIGGMFSVALSVASRRPAVSRHPALWSPDFPLPLNEWQRPPDRLHRKELSIWEQEVRALLFGAQTLASAAMRSIA